MKNYKTLTTLAAAGLLIAGTASAQTAFADAGSAANNGFDTSETDLRLGAGANSSVQFKTFAVFSVQTILADNPTLVVGDLATTSFTISFDTTNNLALSGAAGTFVTSYMGFTANGAATPLDGTYWDARVVEWNAGVTTLDTGVADTLANQTGITSQSFNLTGVTEGDTANDYVAIGIGYSNQGASSGPSNREQLSNITLSAAAVPEPSAFALLAGMFGLTWVMLRRRA